MFVYWSLFYIYNLNKKIYLDYKSKNKKRTEKYNIFRYILTDMNIVSFDRSAIKSYPPLLPYLSSV